MGDDNTTQSTWFASGLVLLVVLLMGGAALTMLQRTATDVEQRASNLHIEVRDDILTELREVELRDLERRLQERIDEKIESRLRALEE